MGLVLLVDGEPRRARREAGIGRVVPVHGRARVVAAVAPDGLERLLLGEARGQRLGIGALGLRVVVEVDRGQVQIADAQLLALVDKGRAAHREQQHAERLGRVVRPARRHRLGQEVVHGAGLVVVLKEDRAPAEAGHGVLGLDELADERALLPVDLVVPDLGTAQGHLGVLEAEDHVKDAVSADPLGQLLGGDHIGLADGEDVVAVADLALELVQEVQDARHVARHRAHVHHAVAGVGLGVREDRGLLDEGDRVDAEAAHALGHPPVGHVVDGLTDLGALPIEVGLIGAEGVQVVLLARLAPLPGRAAEAAAPVGGHAAVGLGVGPDVPVGFGVVAAGAGLDEPGVLVGRVIEDQVHHDLDPARVGLGEQLVEVAHRAVARVDLVVVLDVVAVVLLRRLVHGGQPEGAHTQRRQVVQARRDAGDGAGTCAFGVLEALGIRLVGDRLLPPRELLCHGILLIDSVPDLRAGSSATSCPSSSLACASCGGLASRQTFPRLALLPRISVSLTSFSPVYRGMP